MSDFFNYTLDSRESSKAHTLRVEKLTIADILQLNNDGYIPDEMTDKLYYFLLDSKALKSKLMELAHDN